MEPIILKLDKISILINEKLNFLINECRQQITDYNIRFQKTLNKYDYIFSYTINKELFKDKKFSFFNSEQIGKKCSVNYEIDVSTNNHFKEYKNKVNVQFKNGIDFSNGDINLSDIEYFNGNNEISILQSNNNESFVTKEFKNFSEELNFSITNSNQISPRLGIKFKKQNSFNLNSLTPKNPSVLNSNTNTSLRFLGLQNKNNNNNVTSSNGEITKSVSINKKISDFTNENKTRLSKDIEHNPQDEYKLDQQSNLNFVDETIDCINLSSYEGFQIPYESTFNQVWRIIITSLLMFYLIVFPLETFSEIWIRSTLVQIQINMAVEQFLITDLILNFLISHRDKNGKKLNSIYQIAINQISSYFIIDFISSTPIINLTQFKILNFNTQAPNIPKLLRLPKYLFGIKEILKQLEINLSSIIDQSMQISNFTKREQSYNSLSKFLLQFLILANFLACQLISFSQFCDPENSCYNWFAPLMETEQYQDLSNPSARLHNVAIEIESNHQDNAWIQYQNQILRNQRHEIQIDAWQFVLQTATTVGQGDVTNYSSNERLFWSLCMVLGVIHFSMVSAHIMEQIISESMNIQRNNEHLGKIEKLLKKQKIIGQSRRFLQLLGDSVQTESNQNELDFIKLLPRQMSDFVLNHLWEIYQNKIKLLDLESVEFFKKFMKVAKFRRCISEESICTENDNQHLNIIQSGQVGVNVRTVHHFLKIEQLEQIGVGDELGQGQLLNIRPLQKFDCLIISEIIEINLKDQISLISNSSLKGIEQIISKILDYLVDIYMILILMNSMIKMGQQIDNKWQKIAILFFNMDKNDQNVMNQFQSKIILKKKRKDISLKINYPKLINKWQFEIMNMDSQKQVLSKCKSMLKTIIILNPQYEEICNQVSKISNPILRDSQIISNSSSLLQ